MIESFERKYTKFFNLAPKSEQRIRLVLYVIIIITTQVMSAAMYQKIHKTAYFRSNLEIDVDGVIKSDLFQNPFAVPLFYTIFSLILGYITMPNTNNQTQVPKLQILKLSILGLIGLLLLPICMIQTSVIIVYIINSCQLVIVVLLAVFLSNSSPRFKVHSRQIIISIFLVFGVVLINIFNQEKDKGSNKPITWFSGILLLIMLLAGGYRPEIFAQIRDKYSPAPSYIFFSSCKYNFTILLLLSLATLNLYKLIIFIWQHDHLLLDLCLQGIIMAISQLFLYRGGLQYKQHIMPTILSLCKLFTLIFNSLVFGHHWNLQQVGGLGIVFGSLFIDIYVNYRQDGNEQISEETRQDGIKQIEGEVIEDNK